MNQTLILIKPDAVRRGLDFEIENMLRREGLEIVRRRWFDRAPVELIKAHYCEHKGQPYFEPTVLFMTSGPIWALVVQGEEVISRSREIIGHRDPEVARQQNPRSIRARYGMVVEENLVHGSDSPESARRELRLWFPDLYPAEIDSS